MDESVESSSQASANLKLLIGFLWVFSIIFTGFVGYGFGKESVGKQTESQAKVLNAQTNQIASVQDSITTPVPIAVEEKTETATAPTIAPIGPASSSSTTTESVCSKTGFAQKWEYLKPYVLKPNDSLQSIARDELKDETRVNELMQLNGVGPFVVGATVYLPPSSITKSSGKIKQIYGKLVEKNDSSWHISFTGDKSGQGILISSFLFQGVPNTTTTKVGDCLTVLLDDGYKIYSLALQ